MAEAATSYYVDATSGSDANSGLSELTAWKTISKVNGASFGPGDKILFKRGETWREQLRPHSGTGAGYITYGAYGSGNKPLLLGSVAKNNLNDWTNEGGNIWSATGLITDVGNIVFNDEAITGFKVMNQSDLDAQGKYWYDHTNQVLYLYSQINPASYYSNIECALRMHIIDETSKHHIIYQNLDLRYGAQHGIGGGNVHHIIVRGCDFSYIGGGKQSSNLRYGNGIEFWNYSHDTIVERCRFSEIYDAAMTTQGDGTNEKYNQYFRHNIIWNSEYCFEYWNRPSTSATDDIYFENNTCVNAGSGWGHDQRWSPYNFINGRHLAFYWSTADTRGVHIRNNILYEATDVDFLIDLLWNGVENLFLDYNAWYQSSGMMIEYQCSGDPCEGEYMMSEFAQYQADTGQDANSLVVDPLFNDIGNNDFRPATGNPVCTMSSTGNFVGALPCVDINDTDGDGMPDSFEILYGFNPDNPADGDHDDDSDGLSNFWEYAWGTSPFNPDTDSDGWGDADDSCPITAPVNSLGMYYSSLQTAYDLVSDGATIQSQYTEFAENLSINMDKSIILQSGFDCAYSAIVDVTTIIGNVIVSNGSLTIDSGNLVVQN